VLRACPGVAAAARWPLLSPKQLRIGFIPRRQTPSIVSLHGRPDDEHSIDPRIPAPCIELPARAVWRDSRPAACCLSPHFTL